MKKLRLRRLVVALCLPAAVAAQGSGLSAATKQQAHREPREGRRVSCRQQQQPDGTWRKPSRHHGDGGRRAAAQPGRARQGARERRQDARLPEGPGQAGRRHLREDDPALHHRGVGHGARRPAAGRRTSRSSRRRAQYLAEHLLDEGEGVAKSDKFYGGMGYGGTSDGGRADIISLEYGLRAMKEAELPANDPAWQKAITFLQRTQNNSETNDQTWAANDGGFIYYPGYSQVDGDDAVVRQRHLRRPHQLRVGEREEERSPRAGGAEVDPRQLHRRREPRHRARRRVYYYYMVFAKALQAIGEPIIVDAKGRSHNWREDLGRKLLRLQHPEGYWVNDRPGRDAGQQGARHQPSR